MSTFADVQELYSNAKGLWAKSRTHLLAHAVLAIVIFGFGHAHLPQIPVPQIHPKELMENSWFKLAKETGVIYVCLALPFIALGLYGSMLRIFGRFLTQTVFLLVPSKPRPYGRLAATILEPFAILCGRDDFELADLTQKAREPQLQLDYQKSAEATASQTYLSSIGTSAFDYFGDFALFAIGWILLFKLLPDLPWVQSNRELYWRVLLILGILVAFSFFRVRQVLAKMPEMRLLVQSAVLKKAPEFQEKLNVPAERSRQILRRIRELLEKEAEQRLKEPSLFRYLKAKFVSAKSSNSKPKSNYGWPFPDIYLRGQSFRFHPEKTPTTDTKKWLSDYLAYRYYRLYWYLRGIALSLTRRIKALVTGMPLD
jgi:hypothetical protein